MRKWIVVLFAAVASALVLMVPAGSAAPDVSGLCTTFGDFGVSHGQCVSTGQEFFYGANGNKSGQGATDAVGLCKFFDGWLKAVGAGGLKGVGANFGECVTYFNS